MTPGHKQTRVLRVNPGQPEPHVIQEAAQVIRRGGLVVFPTETVYGLGANAFDTEAVAQIFTAKGRPTDNPLIVHIARPEELLPLVASVPDHAMELVQRFWPGPLTIALDRSARVPDIVTAGLPTVGVRIPDHAVALALIQAAGVPIAAPSANLAGRPSPTRAQHVIEDLDGKVDMILDAGETGVGVESTFLDLSTDPPLLCRPGGVSLEDIMAVIGPVAVDVQVGGGEVDGMVRSPGQKYAHYAPKARLVLVEGPSLLRMQEVIKKLALEYSAEGLKVGILTTEEGRREYQAQVVMEVGSRKDLAMVAAALFSALRAFDRHGVDIILSESFSEAGIGLAIMNRLRRAAGGQIVQA